MQKKTIKHDFEYKYRILPDFDGSDSFKKV